MLPRELRNHIMTPALVPGWQQLARRSPRPGEATDFAAAGVPYVVIRKLGPRGLPAGSAGATLTLLYTRRPPLSCYVKGKGFGSTAISQPRRRWPKGLEG